MLEFCTSRGQQIGGDAVVVEPMDFSALARGGGIRWCGFLNLVVCINKCTNVVSNYTGPHSLVLLPILLMAQRSSRKMHHAVHAAQLRMKTSFAGHFAEQTHQSEADQ